MQYSQYSECEFIMNHFRGRIGRFMDVGAYDGLNFSNTRCLMERGWAGVCIEPSPLVFPYLVSNTEQFAPVQSMQVGILPDTFQGHGRMWVTQDALSTFVKEHHDTIKRHNPAVSYTQAMVPTLRWHEFLKIHPEPFDFINIDVEGMNWELLRDGPLAEMVCIEMDPVAEVPRMKEHFRIFGMPNHKEIGGNLLAWR